METKFDDMDDLIGKVLAGEATPDEMAKVEAWKAEAAANEKYIDHLKIIFEKAASPNIQLQVDADAAWNAVKIKIHSRKELPFIPGKVHSGFSWKIAAGIVFMLGLGYIVYQWNRPVIEIYAAEAETSIVQDSLPDGSIAVLNKKSKLSYEYNSNEKVRRVKLTGEAYFSIKHEEEKSFVVETGEILIRDIGTEFNVNAYPDKDTIEIIVAQGEVQFYTLNDAGLLLKAGEKGIYSKRSREFYKVENIDINDLAYKTKVFRFINTEMTEVVKLLNKVYNSRIKLANESIHKCRLTANFSEDNPETIVEVIAETMGFSMTRSKDEILLDGKGCNNK